MTGAPPPPPSPPVVVVQKKRGLGCFGCGCAVLVLILLLLAALVGGVAYYLYDKGAALTSVTPSTVPTFDGGDDVYRAAAQKLNDFNQASRNNQPATLELSADEINTLIARDPDFAANHVRLFVTLNDDRAQIEASLPTAFLPLSPFKNRFVNADIDFSPVFDPQAKTLSFTLHHLRVGPDDIAPDSLSAAQSEFDTVLETEMQQSADVKHFLDRAKSISIRDGKLVIETE